MSLEEASAAVAQRTVQRAKELNEQADKMVKLSKLRDELVATIKTDEEARAREALAHARTRGLSIPSVRPRARAPLCRL
jgi:hypothetical protein